MHKWLAFVLLLASLATTGCNLLTPIIFVGEQKKQVSSEFDKLADDNIAVLVWTDPATLFDYPHARFELAAYIGEKLSGELSQRGLGTRVADSRDVEDFIQKNISAQIDPQAVARKFDSDFVIYLEVTEFQFRDPHQPQFLQGKIGASVRVYDFRADPGRPVTFELTPVNAVHPEGTPALFRSTNAPFIRETTYRKFAEYVARKFYEYTIDL